MVFLPNDRSGQSAVATLVRSRLLPNGYDLVAFALLIAAIVLVLRGGGDMRASLDALSSAPVSLDIGHLPEYALRTTLRMFAAIIASLIFTSSSPRWPPRAAAPSWLSSRPSTSCSRCRCSAS